uniref:LAGLIDADG homing endonuclease n=1 Tax=Romanomermis culicivorax TaxID=13658 RepID=A0A915J1Z4_ROMCU
MKTDLDVSLAAGPCLPNERKISPSCFQLTDGSGTPLAAQVRLTLPNGRILIWPAVADDSELIYQLIETLRVKRSPIETRGQQINARYQHPMFTKSICRLINRRLQNLIVDFEN